MPMNPEAKRLWLEALRSGDYKQGRSYLRTTNGTYCCLGVACDIYANTHPEDRQHRWYRRPTGHRWCRPTGHDHFLFEWRSALLPPRILEWLGINRGEESVLMKMNDDEPAAPFTDIADYIEREL